MKLTKKIAFATAAALAIVGVSTVAHATPLSVTVASVANTTTPAAPYTVAVPATNIIDAGHSVAITATADTGTVVTFSASATVKLVGYLAAQNLPVTVNSGTSVISTTSNGSAITLYAYTTSTSVGYVNVTNGSYSTVVYVQGTPGPVYNVAVNTPTSLSTGTVATASFATTDIFGNLVGGQTLWSTIVNGTFADGSVVKQLVTSSVSDATVVPALVLGVTTQKILSSNTGSIVLTVSIPVSPTQVAGFPAPVLTAVSNISVVDLNATVASLNATVTSLNAQIAALTKTVADNKAADAAALTQALADAKTASDSATATALATAKAASDAELANANATYKLAYNKLVLKYNKLVLAYITKAKKYKFSSNLTALAAK